MVAGEGRPKRACADGIDYAGTDQVPGWTVRVSFYFLHFFFFVLFGNGISKFFSRPLSLSLRLSGFSFFFFFVVVACWCCCLLVTIRADGVLSRIADDEMLKIVLLRI
jgi:hypothetical protein